MAKARAKKRYSIMFTNDITSGCFDTYKSREKAEFEMAYIMKKEAYEVSIGYKDLHLKCEIVETIVYQFIQAEGDGETAHYKNNGGYKNDKS